MPIDSNDVDKRGTAMDHSELPQVQFTFVFSKQIMSHIKADLLKGLCVPFASV
jgi:hypothetical protein